MRFLYIGLESHNPLPRNALRRAAEIRRNYLRSKDLKLSTIFLFLLYFPLWEVDNNGIIAYANNEHKGKNDGWFQDCSNPVGCVNSWIFCLHFEV